MNEIQKAMQAASDKARAVRQQTRAFLKDHNGETLKNTYIVYAGPSMFTGKPIVALASGFVVPSKNGKTGPILQVSIICSDQHPQDAVDSGLDCSICCNCPFRKTMNDGKRLCYVNLKAYFSMYGALCRGSYSALPSFELFKGWEARLGAYGDPAAIPEDHLRPIVHNAEMATGYTHAWKHFPGLSDVCMASVVTDAEYNAAKRLGFNTFRVRPGSDFSVNSGERLCLAQTRGLTCQECRICEVKGLDVIIDVHGTDRVVNQFNERYN